MKISIGADHAGFVLKKRFIEVLDSQGRNIIDRGTFTADRVDYPPCCAAIARDVAEGSDYRSRVPLVEFLRQSRSYVNHGPTSITVSLGGCVRQNEDSLNIKSLLGTALWLGTLAVSLFVTFVALNVAYPASFDTCQSFNTPIGWIIVSFFLILTTGVGVFLRQLLRLSRILIAIGLSGIGAILFLYLLVAGTGCQLF